MINIGRKKIINILNVPGDLSPASGFQEKLSKQILQEHFQAGDVAKDQDATLMFLREEFYRQGNLDNPSSIVQIDPKGSARIDMDPGIIQPEVLAGMQWQPYRYKDIGSWEAYPIVEYWQALDGKLHEEFGGVAGQNFNLAQAGELAASKIYYLSLFQGTTGVVRIGAAVTGADFGSEQFIRAVVSLTVSIVVGLILFAISLIPVAGQIIVAIVALIDAVITLVCKIVGSSAGICSGIVGTVVAKLTSINGVR